MSDLSNRLLELTFEKINFTNDEVESRIENLVRAGLELDEAADEFTAAAAGDIDQEDTANALVDLADLVDTLDIDAEQSEKLDGIVNRIIKGGTDEQKAATVDLFNKVLAFQLVVKEENAWIDANLQAADEEEV